MNHLNDIFKKNGKQNKNLNINLLKIVYIYITLTFHQACSIRKN